MCLSKQSSECGTDSFKIAFHSLVSLHVLQFLRIIFEEHGASSSDRLEQEHALVKAVDVMEMSLGSGIVPDEKIKDEGKDSATSSSGTAESSEAGSPENLLGIDKLSLDDVPANHHRKMALLYALLSACVADKPVSQEQEERKSSHFRKGYDARHRVALRLIATWLDVKWIKMVCTTNYSFSMQQSNKSLAVEFQQTKLH